MMKIVILAGGLGTRISEETENKPKPMVLIDENPILWHLMNIFSKQEYTDFVLALGYKQEVARDWVETFKNDQNWSIDAFDTGIETQTGGRIKRCMRRYPDQRLLVTYGDGLANVSIKKLLDFHASHGKLATVTAVRPPARFGYLHLEENRVTKFGEKIQSDEGWINGGFFILEPKVLDFIYSDSDLFETSSLPELARVGELMAFKHHAFWKPMDTLREKNELEELARQTLPPWLNL